MRNVRLVLPPPDDFESWKKLLNLLYLLEEDHLFAWLRTVRAAVEEAEQERAERQRAA